CVVAFPCRAGSYKQVGKCDSRGAVGAMIKLTCLVAFVGVSVLPLVAQAQSYPVRSITVVVPFPAGGPSDVVARIVTDRMGRTLGQQMVIENVGAAAGTLGSAGV